MAIEYISGSELPNPELTWLDSDGAVRDFASGWTFRVLVGVPGQAAAVTKTAGITSAAVAPNVTIAWASGELDALVPGTYTVDVEATFTSSGQSIRRRFDISVIASILEGV